MVASRQQTVPLLFPSLSLGSRISQEIYFDWTVIDFRGCIARSRRIQDEKITAAV